ncbi:protein kinase domain-containing protein [Bradyrhizobium sp. HKCCYLS2038]|uniref:protein kinase domain-containing protein n=1 Tax=unclassified Bradyrhizobium TaxID=2631580 RepID=UPI003EBE2E9F
MAKTRGPYGGRWKSGDTLDQGGQAQVILVEDLMRQYQGPCALKRVFNAERHERFRDEVEAIKTLSHPNIVPLLDHSALDAVPGDDARQYLVMPRAKGGNLAKAVDRYRGRLDDVLTVAIQIAHGLQAAHAARIIHRDVKPENILFPGEGHAIWVADFGICLIQAREQRNTRDGEVVGPAVFMAPELEDGGQLAVTPDADIYSLGKVIYYMITGGVRMPRERLHEEAYAAPFAAGGRLLRLKILLSQMICARPYRIQAMPEVIRRLESIAAEAASEPPDAFNAAAIDRLKQAALADRSRVQDQADEEERRQAWFNDVHMDILALVHGELAAHAARLTEPGLIKSGAQPFNPRGATVMGRVSKSQALDGHEITFQHEGAHERITALQFAFYRKAIVAPAGQSPKEPVGIWLTLQTREPDNRPVQRCHAFVNRTQQGRGRFAYAIATEPARFELDISEWPDKADDLRTFVQNALEAFPELIRGGLQQFVMFELNNKPRRR